VTASGSSMVCTFSTWDDNPRTVTLPISSLQWIPL
jgi:hypothetical protein